MCRAFLIKLKDWGYSFGIRVYGNPYLQRTHIFEALGPKTLLYEGFWVIVMLRVIIYHPKYWPRKIPNCQGFWDILMRRVTTGVQALRACLEVHG